MRFLWIFPYYLGWHYGRGTSETFSVFKNFLFFIPRFFSIKVLFETLFSPFQRLKENYAGGLNPGQFAEVIVVNLIMRIFGFIVRSFIIMLGVATFIIVFFVEIVLFIIWITLPFLLAFMFFVSIISLINL
jgi:hypothetical protein